MITQEQVEVLRGLHKAYEVNRQHPTFAAQADALAAAIATIEGMPECHRLADGTIAVPNDKVYVNHSGRVYEADVMVSDDPEVMGALCAEFKIIGDKCNWVHQRQLSECYYTAAAARGEVLHA